MSIQELGCLVLRDCFDGTCSCAMAFRNLGLAEASGTHELTNQKQISLARALTSLCFQFDFWKQLLH